MLKEKVLSVRDMDGLDVLISDILHMSESEFQKEMIDECDELYPQYLLTEGELDGLHSFRQVEQALRNIVDNYDDGSITDTCKMIQILQVASAYTTAVKAYLKKPMRLIMSNEYSPWV